MQNFLRGQRAKISQFCDGTSFQVRVVLQSARVAVFDFVCFGLDEREQLSDDRFMVFFNQKSAPNDAIKLDDLGDQKASFAVDLALLPPEISRLVFTIAVDGAGAMKDLDAGVFELRDATNSQAVAEYRFSGDDFQKEGALMLAALYRKDGEWRLWAQGQGFEGDLGALLRHFGGEEIEATESESSTRLPTSSAGQQTTAQPTASQSTSTSQPPPPISAPVSASNPLVVPPVPANATSLQQTIVQAVAGSTITLPRGEHQGPIYIDKPLILDGGSAVVWAQSGPVVVVQSVGVTLRDLEIEATAPDENVPNSQVALWVAPGLETQLHHVRVRGEIVGVAQADGAWKLPPFLSLGEFAPRVENSFQIEIETPHACEIKSTVVGVSVVPAQVANGRHNIRIRVQNIAADTLLAGVLEVSTGGIARTIPLSGRTSMGASAAVHDLMLWSVDDGL